MKSVKSISAHCQGHNYIFVICQRDLLKAVFWWTFSVHLCFAVLLSLSSMEHMILFPDCKANFTGWHCKYFAHESQGFSHRKTQNCYYPNANIKEMCVL